MTRPLARLVLAAVVLVTTSSRARAHAVRRLFEPTDLELDDAGELEVDVQLGLIRGRPLTHLMIPDFELDLGLTKDIELDVDGALGFDGPESGAPGATSLVTDNLWVALKAGLVSVALDSPAFDVTLGTQLGPKLPLARGARGLGVEGLLLLAASAPIGQLALNGGVLFDPIDGELGRRPLGLEGGIDLARVLDAGRRWTLMAELGGIRFRRDIPPQLNASAGVSFAPLPALELSVSALAGLTRGSDRFGVLVGVSPHLALWGR